MAVIVIPSRWQRQPTGPVELDWSHGMAGDLMGAFVGASGDIDLTQPHTPAQYTSAAAAAIGSIGTEAGIARLIGGTDGTAYWQIQRRGFDSTTTGLTAWGRLAPWSADPSNVVFGTLRVANSRYFGWGYASGTRYFRAYARAQTGGTQYSAVSTSVISRYQWHDAGAIYTPGTLSAWLNGAEVASLACTPNLTANQFTLAEPGGVIYAVAACYQFAGAHPEYMLELSRNPWQVFRKRLYKFISLGGGTIYNESISESASASDSLSALAVFGGALSEAASAADTLAASAALAGALSEASSAADVVAAAAAFSGALSESASAADSVSASLVRVGGLTESASADDALSSSAQMTSALSESVSAADIIDGSIGAAIYAAELVESVSAADSYTAAAVFASAIVEAVAAQDVVTAAAVLSAVLAEVASASDAVAGSLVIAGAIAEAVSAADGWVGAVGSQVFEAELSEAVAAGDVFAALGVLARYGVRGAQGVQSQMRTRSNIQTARRYN